MNDAKASPPPAQAPENPQASTTPNKPTTLSRGMATLLQGTQPPAQTNSETEPKKTADPEAPARPVPRSRLLRVSLVIADLLLLALATRLVLKSQGQLGFIEITLCVVAVGLGAWLTCLALWRES